MKRHEKIVSNIVRERTAGREERRVRGYGWTEKEALDDAMANDQSENGTHEGYGGGYVSMTEVKKTTILKKPNKSKTVSIQKLDLKKGPVKKQFFIEKYRGWSTTSQIERDPRFSKRYDTQGEVLKVAKDLSLEYGEELLIQLGAFCVGDTKLAIVKPGPSQKGEWIFTCEFRS